MKPLMKWAGGKRKWAKQICSHMQAGARLTEPFCGMGAVSIEAWSQGLFQQFAWYDADPIVIGAYKQIRDDYSTFARRYKMLPQHPSPYEYKTMAGAGADALGGPAVYLAAMVYGGFNGIWRPRNGIQTVSRGLDHLGKMDLHNAEDLAVWMQRRVSLYCMSYEQSLAQTTDTVYADPPYAGSKGMYETKVDQASIRDALETCNACHVLASNCDCDEIRDLYNESRWRIEVLGMRGNRIARGDAKPQIELLMIRK